MKIRFPSLVWFSTASLALFFLASCGPGGPIVITTLGPISATPSPGPATATYTATAACPPEDRPCPADSMTLTAEMATRFASTPSSTPPAGMTVIPMPGNLGWGAVYGKILDGVTGFPIDGATVECEHFSYTSPSPCKGTTTTNAEGIYSFVPVFFRDTDRIVLRVEATGYEPLRFEQSFFTRPEFHADLGLFPAGGGTQTPTPFLMCTPPPCPGSNFACGNPNGCPGGCGTICLTATPTP